MVTIDGTDTKDLGFRVSRITGDLDVLRRKMQDNFNWPDSDGEQSYTTAADIVFQPRVITLEGHMVTTRDSFESTLNTLKTALNAVGLRALITPYSTVTRNVYCRDGVIVGRLTPWANNTVHAAITVKFYEPAPDDTVLVGDTMPTPKSIPPGGWPADDVRWRMDDRDLKYNWGISVLSMKGYFSQPKQKRFPVYSDLFTDGNPYYQAAADVFYEGMDIDMRLLIRADTLAELAESLRLFKKYLFLSGLRTFKLPYYALTFDAYSIAGAPVTMLTRSTHTKQAAEINLKLRLP